MDHGDCITIEFFDLPMVIGGKDFGGFCGEATMELGVGYEPTFSIRLMGPDGDLTLTQYDNDPQKRWLFACIETAFRREHARAISEGVERLRYFEYRREVA